MAGRRNDPEAWIKHLAASQHVRIAGATPAARLNELAPAVGSRPLRVGAKANRLQGLPLLDWQLEQLRAPPAVREFRFHETRQWSADRCWPEPMLILEYEGAVYLNGRHTRGEGFENDIEKYNAATLMGYRVLRATDNTVRSGAAAAAVMQALQL